MNKSQTLKDSCIQKQQQCRLYKCMRGACIVFMNVLLIHPAMASIEPINQDYLRSPKQERKVQLAQTSIFGQSKIGLIGGTACVEGPKPTKEYFESWFSSYYYIPGIGTLKNIGANGISSIGEWNKRDADLNLGPTSAGAIVVCFPKNYSPAKLTVQEYIGNGIWRDLWWDKGVYSGGAYGYWFKGLAVRRIRLLVRYDPGVPGQLFYWGGSY